MVRGMTILGRFRSVLDNDLRPSDQGSIVTAAIAQGGPVVACLALVKGWKFGMHGGSSPQAACMAQWLSGVDHRRVWDGIGFLEHQFIRCWALPDRTLQTPPPAWQYMSPRSVADWLAHAIGPDAVFRKSMVAVRPMGSLPISRTLRRSAGCPMLGAYIYGSSPLSWQQLCLFSIGPLT